MQPERTKTTKCEDCGKRISKWLGADYRYPQGIKTATGYICGPCMTKHHGE